MSITSISTFSSISSFIKCPIDVNTILGFSFDNCDILDDAINAKSKIGYLPEVPPLYLDMTVDSYLKFVFDLKKIKLPKEEPQ